MGHALFNNLRNGNWLLDYIVGRLFHKPTDLTQVAAYLDRGFTLLKRIPRYLIPKYFDLIILSVYNGALERAFSLMSDTICKTPNGFVRGLALGSIQMYSIVSNATIPSYSGKARLVCID